MKDNWRGCNIIRCVDVSSRDLVEPQVKADNVVISLIIDGCAVTPFVTDEAQVRFMRDRNFS